MVPLVAEPLIDRLLDVVCAPGAPEMGHGTALSEVLAHPSNLGTTLAARLAPRTDEEVAMFLDTVSRFVARSKREGGFETELKQALETLKSLVPIVTARSLQVSPSVDAMLALLGARAARSTPALPRALPATVPEALELLATRGVKLKPATHVPKGLPADLAAFYARATALPFFIVKPTELAKAQRALLREVEGLNPGDGVTLDTLSPPKRWVALGTDAAGDHLFLDPAHPNFTFRFIHDEQEFDVEPCLAQLLCWFGARPWADEHLLTDALTTAYLTAKKRAEKAWKKNRR